MPGQSRHRVDTIVAARQCLDREPFVEHQRVAFVARVESRQRLRALRRLAVGKHAQSALPVGHIVRRLELPQRYAGRILGPRSHQIAQSHRTQPPRAFRSRGIFEAVSRGRRISGAPQGLELTPQLRAQRLARRVDRLGVDDQHLIAEKRLGRQQHGLGDEGRVERSVAQRVAHSLDHRLMVHRPARHRVHQRVDHQLLHRLVAGEWIVVMR